MQPAAAANDPIIVGKPFTYTFQWSKAGKRPKNSSAFLLAAPSGELLPIVPRNERDSATDIVFTCPRAGDYRLLVLPVGGSSLEATASIPLRAVADEADTPAPAPAPVAEDERPVISTRLPTFTPGEQATIEVRIKPGSKPLPDINPAKKPSSPVSYVVFNKDLSKAIVLPGKLVREGVYQFNFIPPASGEYRALLAAPIEPAAWSMPSTISVP